MRFDGNATGSGAALMCDDYEKARVLDLCEAMPPVYVATDDDDPGFVAHLKSRGASSRRTSNSARRVTHSRTWIY